jgi:hypothetical protein
MRFLLLSLLILTSFEARALSLTSETEAGTAIFTESVEGDGNITPENKDKKIDQWLWNLALTYSKTSSTDEATQTKVVDKTTEVAGGVDWESADHLTVGLGLSFSSTPDENLVGYGPEINFGYTYEFAKSMANSKTKECALNDTADRTNEARQKPSEKDAKCDSDADAGIFHPSIGLNEAIQYMSYVEKLNGVTRLRNRTRAVTGTNDIHQTSFQTDLKVKPYRFLRTTLRGTVYHYDRDVNQFLAQLDSARGVRFNNSGLSSLVSGLPAYSGEILMDFYIGENWEVDLSATDAVSITDYTHAWTYKLDVFRDLNDQLRLGLGYERDVAPTATDNIGKLTIAYGF